MIDSLKKLKARRTLYAIIKSAAFGIALGLLVAGGMIYAAKIQGITIAALRYILAGAGSAIAGGGITFLILRPTYDRVAKDADTLYSLGQKAQTAYEFREDGGAIAEIQRRDAESILSSAKYPYSGGAAVKRALAGLWQYILIGVIGVAVFVSAAVLPASALEYDPPFAVTDTQLVAVRELIDNINSSDIPEDKKALSAAELESLLVKLQTANTQKKMERAVYAAVDGVDGVLTAGNSYRDISTSIGRAGLGDLAIAIRRGVAVYMDYTFVNYDEVKTFNKEKINRVISASTRNMESLRVALNLGGEGVDGAAALGELSSAITGALISSGIPETDALYAALRGFASSVSALAAQAVTTAGEELAAAAVTLFSENTAILAEPLASQAYILVVNRHVKYKLCSSFGLPAPDTDYTDGFNDAFGGGQSEAGGDENDPDENHSGGYGTGETIYGSDDLIYDPSTGGYVKYGELLNRYYAIAQEYLRSGNLTPEQEARVRAYFEILFSGFADEN